MRIALFQYIIDRIRNKITYVDAFVSKYYLYNNFTDYDTLVLGSSHLNCAYIPSENEVSMCVDSQDLYYSYELYKLFIKKNPNIKNIIISFSVFTPGHCLLKTSNRNLTIFYKLLFGIDYQYSDEVTKFGLNKLEKSYKKAIDKCTKRFVCPKDYRGTGLFGYQYKTDIDCNKAREIALKHFKNNQRKNSQMYICKDLIDATKTNGQNLYFVIAPMPEEYRKCLPPKRELFAELYQMVSDYKHVEILNFYSSEIFKHDDFLNEDHLNKNGADKLTKIVREKIKQLH